MKLTASRSLPRRLRSDSGLSRSGFSLAELMVVIVIIALLATLVVQQAPRFLSSGYKTKL
ncbi:MAG: prepilin-type N-terminal cleavage/methylation domain-containing protein, partial [Planctomycetota bacterium]